MDAEGPPPLLATPHRARTVSTSTLLNEAAPLLGATALNEPVKATARLVCVCYLLCMSLLCIWNPYFLVYACVRVHLVGSRLCAWGFSSVACPALMSKQRCHSHTQPGACMFVYVSCMCVCACRFLVCTVTRCAI